MSNWVTYLWLNAPILGEPTMPDSLKFWLFCLIFTFSQNSLWVKIETQRITSLWKQTITEVGGRFSKNLEDWNTVTGRIGVFNVLCHPETFNVFLFVCTTYCTAVSLSLSLHYCCLCLCICIICADLSFSLHHSPRKSGKLRWTEIRSLTYLKIFGEIVKWKKMIFSVKL